MRELLLLLVLSPTSTEDDAPPARGLTVREAGTFDGETLVGPLNSTKVHLIDMDGEVTHTWETGRAPGGGIYLRDDGHLLRGAREDDSPVFRGGGIGGHLQVFAPDGTVTWHYELHGKLRQLHHDVAPLANGNVLAIAWEYHSPDEAKAHGRDDDAVGDDGFWPDVILEIEPTRPVGGKIVWEWRAWDHLIQDRDPNKPNYGSVPGAPGRLDINADHRDRPPMTPEEQARQEKVEKEMEALGYTGGAKKKKKLTREERKAAAERKKKPDWMHTNSVDHHPGLDLIVISSPQLGELFVIDHSTTTAEASGSTGGRFGKGGDILWRWGNPRNYGAGDDKAKALFYQHNPEWLRTATDGELRLTVFNNGGGRPDGDYSSVDELSLPFDAATGFSRAPGTAYGPRQPTWSHQNKGAFYAPFISGASRLPNGNTLICEGPSGRVFEINPAEEIVWEWKNPLGGEITDSGPGGNAPTHALFRATRFPDAHPALEAIGASSDRR